jgi:hypothetical protein
MAPVHRYRAPIADGSGHPSSFQAPMPARTIRGRQVQASSVQGAWAAQYRSANLRDAMAELQIRAVGGVSRVARGPQALACPHAPLSRRLENASRDLATSTGRSDEASPSSDKLSGCFARLSRPSGELSRRVDDLSRSKDHLSRSFCRLSRSAEHLSRTFWRVSRSKGRLSRSKWSVPRSKCRLSRTTGHVSRSGRACDAH